MVVFIFFFVKYKDGISIGLEIKQFKVWWLMDLLGVYSPLFLTKQT